MQGKSTSTQTRPMLRALAATLVILVVLAIGTVQAETVYEYPTPAFAGPGDFCVDDAGYPTGANCTAMDTRISKLTPDMTEVCTAVGDKATVEFVAELVIGASTRYDLAMYIAADGGNAEIGSHCYKDVLQPVAVLNEPGDPMNPLGTGPFKNEDGDLCGEANQTVGAIYKLHSMEITCTDGDGDGVVDPISTCLSWAHNANTYDCQGVTALVPGPGTSSKCNCQEVPLDPPILLYQGYDWGDLPDDMIDANGVNLKYGTLLNNDGPRHAIQRVDRTVTGYNDYEPETQGGVAAVWLGQLVDYGPTYGETNGQPTLGADGDDLSTVKVDDEDGVTYLGSWSPLPTMDGGSFSVFVNSSDGTCTGCRLGFWIDWNQNGDFMDAGESYVKPVGYGANTVRFDIPYMPTSPLLYARFRLYDGNYMGDILPTGLVTNGEVEDYRFDISPTAVDLLYFEAEGAKKSVVLSWATSNEIDNAGFNLYRAKSVGAERIKLNEELIPSNVYPGSPSGASYEWVDATVKGARTYYYWLEDVEFDGDATLHGPVDARAVVGKAK